MKPDETNNSAHIGLADIYQSDKDWLETMNYYTPAFYDGFNRMTLGLLIEGTIPRYIKELIVACICTLQGFIRGAILHMKNAIELGATDDEIAEMLAAMVLSRGPRVYVEGLKVWQAAGGKPQKRKLPDDSTRQALNEKKIKEYFENYYGASLPHIRVLVENKQFDVLQGYYDMRTFCVADHVLPQKFKEFLYIAVNSADMRPEIAELHIKGALQAGIPKEEILESLLLGIMAGGVASWLYASKIYEETLE